MEMMENVTSVINNYEAVQTRSEYVKKEQATVEDLKVEHQATGENLKVEPVKGEANSKLGNNTQQNNKNLSDLMNDGEDGMTPEDMKAQQDRIRKAIETANKKIVSPSIELNFSVHERTNRICIQVKNKDTGDTIREIPSEKLLDMVADLCEIAGKVIDVKR